MPQVADQQQSQVTSGNVVTLGNVVPRLRAAPGVTSVPALCAPSHQDSAASVKLSTAESLAPVSRALLLQNTPA